mmetsp:Transcript_57229/g.121681  ORF Transcript_57229/g.121681 Transcript_57229/m.121681 type:complete len:82 (+) Transcript_57229:703-948(+)
MYGLEDTFMLILVYLHASLISVCKFPFATCPQFAVADLFASVIFLLLGQMRVRPKWSTRQPLRQQQPTSLLDSCLSEREVL